MLTFITKCYHKFRNDQHFSELARGSSVAFIFKALSIGMNFIFFWLVARLTGAGTVGVFSIGFAVLSLFCILGKGGMDMALLKLIPQYISQNKNDLVRPLFNKSLKILLPFNIVLSVLLYYSAPFIAENIFSKPYLADTIKLFSFCLLPYVLLFIISESLRGCKEIMAYSFIQKGLFYVLSAIILLSIWVFFRDSLLVFYSFISGVFLSAVAAWFYWTKKTSYINGVNHQSIITSSALITLALPMLIPSALSFIQSWTDTIILGIYRDDTEVGIYNVALRLGALSSMVLASINSISAPKFSELFATNDMKGLAKVAKQSTKMFFFSSTPILIIFVLFPSFILGLYGKEFTSGSLAFILISIGQFISAISGSVGLILLMTNNQVIFQYITMATSSLGIVLSLWLIPLWGMNGAALSNMIALVMTNILCLIVVYKKFGIFVAYIPFYEH